MKKCHSKTCFNLTQTNFGSILLLTISSKPKTHFQKKILTSEHIKELLKFQNLKNIVMQNSPEAKETCQKFRKAEENKIGKHI